MCVCMLVLPHFLTSECINMLMRVNFLVSVSEIYIKKFMPHV